MNQHEEWRTDPQPYEPAQPDTPAPECAPEPARQETYPFWGYQDVVLVGAMALPLMVVSFMVVGGLFRAANWNPPRAIQLLPAQFLFYALWFLFLYGWLRTRYGRPFWSSMAWNMPPRGLMPSAVLGVGTAVAVIVLGAILRPPQIEMPIMEWLKDRASLILIGIFATTLGPLCEELAFRGFLLPLLIRSVRTVPGILITAGLFASLHGPEYAWSWQHILLITLAGAAFGWMRYVSASTATATVMHAAYNAVFFLGMLLQRKGLSQ